MRKRFGETSVLRGQQWARPVAWLVLAALFVPVQALAIDSAFVRSLFIPGLGQAQQGHYTRASILAGAAVVSGFGSIVSHIYYDEAVDKYDSTVGRYESLGRTLAEGGVVSIGELESTYAEMQSLHQSADDRLVWRNVFLSALAATYAINLVDVLLSRPDENEAQTMLRLELGPQYIRVTKGFDF